MSCPTPIGMNWNVTSQIEGGRNHSQVGQFYSQATGLHTYRNKDVDTCGYALM
jgi:hypothetical protein